MQECVIPKNCCHGDAINNIISASLSFKHIRKATSIGKCEKKNNYIFPLNSRGSLFFTSSIENYVEKNNKDCYKKHQEAY